MALTYPLFRRGLYEEHLEEASFLYAQKLALRRNPEMPWRRIGEFEQRMEAHVDALVVGSDLALEVCRARSKEGDAGEAFAVACVFCRQKHARLLSEQLKGLDPNDTAKVTAIADALKLELPGEWSGFVENAIARDGSLAPLLARVCGYLRLPVAPALRQAINTATDVAPVIDALGRLRAFEPGGSLAGWLEHPEPEVKRAITLALLRMGMPDVVRTLYLTAQAESWPREALILGGDWSASNVFVRILKAGRGDAECILALGLLGDPSSLQVLYESLKSPELADAAALALHWMTGADLFKDAFVPAPVDEDALSDKELTAWRERGQPPRRDDGTPFGETVRKLSTEKEAWERWFADNAGRFEQNRRYRNGVPYGPEALLGNLAAERGDYRLRAYAFNELAMRYGCDLPFDTEMPVSRQVRALRDVDDWVQSNARRFTPGRWYFAGQPQ